MTDTQHTPKHSAHMKPEASTPYDAPRGDGRGHDDNRHEGSRAHGHHRHHHRHSRHNRRRAVATVLIVVLVLLATTAAAGYCFYGSVRTVKTQAEGALAQAGTLEEQLLSGDSAGAQQSAAAIAQAAQSMHHETSSPLWTAATAIPVAGSDVRSVRMLTALVDDLAQNALVPLADNLSGTDLGSIFTDEGSVDIGALNALVNAVTQVAPVVQRDADAVNSLPEPHLEQLQSPLQKAKEMLARLNDGASTASEVGSVLPALLGANGTRHYLVMAQGNSEIRSSGGFPGQVSRLTVENGKLNMGEFSGLSKNALRRYDTTPGLGDGYPITDVEATAFWHNAGKIPGDAGFIPDFSRVAEIWQWQWADQHGGETLDGIIGVDPVFLQNLLDVVGGVTNEETGYTLDGSTTAQLLLNQVYIDYPDPKDSDAVFVALAQQCVDQVLGNLGKADTVQLVQALATSVQNRNFQMWSANPVEEAALDKLGVTGKLNSDPTAPEVGFYVSNASFCKIDWYLALQIALDSGARNADGTTTYHVTATLHNDLDPALEDSLPWYTAKAGNGEVPKRSAGDEILRVYLTAPAGGSIRNLDVDGYCTSDNLSFTYENLQLISSRVSVQPGETCTFNYDVSTAVGAGRLGVDTTPTGQGTRVVID